MYRNILFFILLLAMSAPAQARTLVFASDATWPPMEMVNTQKEIVGFCPDIIQAMAKAGGFTADIRSTAWDGIFAGLAAGRYDVVASSVSITPKRQRIMDFSDPYFDVKQGIVTRADSKIASKEDLNQKMMGAQIGTSGHFMAKKISENTTKAYDEVGFAMEDLVNGRIDAVLCDDAVAADFALQNPNYAQKLKLAFMITPDEPEYLGFAVKKGNKEVLAILNTALKAIRDSGEYEQIFNKWFKK